MYCKVPHTALLIQPNGNLNVCCTTNAGYDSKVHISEVDDLNEAWKNNKDFIKLRSNDEKTIDEICSNCLRRAEDSKSSIWHKWNGYVNNDRKNLSVDGKIRHLEYTTSNICNQTCVTCCSYFSSKWLAYEQELKDFGFNLNNHKNFNTNGFDTFDRPVRSISNEDIEKIRPLLGDLEIIHLKGGEPFADKKNFKILKKLIEVNNTAIIELTSNFSILPEKYLDILSNCENKVNVTISADGIGKTYEYVRSTPWEKTWNNILRWKELGINGKLFTQFRINVYNMYNLNDWFNFWNVEGPKNNIIFQVADWINSPMYVSPCRVFGREYIEKWLQDYVDIPIEKTKNYDTLRVKNYNSSLTHFDENGRKAFKHFTKFMNYKRKLNIYDIHPELNLL